MKFLSSEFNINLFAVSHLFMSAIGISNATLKVVSLRFCVVMHIISNKYGFGL
jgi:hypothetical protein